MNEKSIAIKESLEFGWNTLKNNFALFLKLIVVIIVISILPAMLLGWIAKAVGGYLAMPLQFLNLVWQAIIGMGMLKICFKLYDKQAVDIPDIWSCVPQTLDYIVVKFLYTAVVVVGLILLVIPGLIWAMQFYLASYLVVDRGAGGLAAMKGSSAITRGAKWNLGIFSSVVLGINIVGAFALGVGLLITVPVTMLASVFVYRRLLAQTEAGGQLVATK